jgi:serine/threonine protein kinase/tetratricopeptide (TPR) repeat protein
MPSRRSVATTFGLPVKSIAPESWLRLRSLLDSLLELDVEARGEYLRSLEGDDAELRPELERLLADAARLSAEPLRNALELAAPSVAADLQKDIDADEMRIDQHIGPYHLVRLLGAGGMGVVYLAKREAGEFTHEVALKLMRTAFASASAKERFDRERQILAGLKHSGIALLFDGGHTADGQSFYTMEYVDGEPVTDYCWRQLDDVKARVNILLQIASALAHAHQNLVVHRDIKPSNVLVDAKGQIKLVDFGLAKALQKSVSPIMTQAGTMPMTPAYAAPEQFHSDAITIATDIYQFGVLSFMILSGRLPYRADPGDSLAWARAVTEEQPMTLARAFDMAHADVRGTPKIRRQLVRDLDAILGKAMAKAPEQRYGSMDAMMADLNAFLDGRPVTARRARAAYFLWRFVARHRYATTASAMAVIALAVAAMVAVHQSRVAIGEADRANAVANFLVELFRVSDPGVNRGERLNANQILEQGAERIEHELASQPEQRARLQSVIGEVYLTMGDYPRSVAALDPSIATLKTARSTDPVDFAHALGLKAFISATQDDSQAALAMLNEAESVLDGSTSRQLEELGSLHTRRAMVFNHLGDYQRSRSEYETALKLRDEIGQQRTLKTAGIHNSFGNLLRALNDLKGAQAEYGNALAIYREIYGSDSKNVNFIIGAGMNLGSVNIDLGNLVEARSLLEKASVFFAGMGGTKSLGYANAEDKLGEIDRLERKFDDAFKHYDNSERACRALFGDHHRSVATPIQNRGQAELERGQFTAALLQFEQALALRLETLPRTHREVAMSLDGRSQALLHLNRYAEAKQDAEEALGIWREALPANHPLIVYSLVHVGLTRFALGDVEGAQVALREARELAPRVLADNAARLDLIRAAIDDPQAALTNPVPAGSYD